jgi:syntaxin 6
MLEDLDRGVDQTDSKLSDAVRRMRKFVRETEGQLPCLLSSAWMLKH